MIFPLFLIGTVDGYSVRLQQPTEKIGAVSVIEKLRGLRLARRAGGSAQSRRRSPARLSRRSIGGGFARTIRSSASCVRSGGAPASHGQSALNLAAARLRHIAGTAWSAKKRGAEPGICIHYNFPRSIRSVKRSIYSPATRSMSY